MKRFYRFAGLTVLFDSGFDIKSTGFSGLFEVPETEPDIRIGLSLCDGYSAGEVRYSTTLYNCVDTADGDTCLQYIEPLTGEVCFELHRAPGGLEGRMTAGDAAQCADMFYLWRYIDLGDIMLERGRIVFHCSFVLDDTGAVLFCGRSGAGKSTQAELWRQSRGAEIINGDKAVLYLKNGELYASSLPVAGTSDICVNREAPVGAIVALSHGTSNELWPMNAVEALTAILSNTMYDARRDGATEKAVTLAGEMLRGVKALRYSCLPEPSAVEKLCGFLEENK